MRKIKKLFFTIVMTILLIVGMPVSVFAAESDQNAKNIVPKVTYNIEMSDEALVGATHISSNIYQENGRLITVDVYEQQDGTIITDTFERSAIAMYSKEGSDTATRTRDLGNWGSISITASFKWYTEGGFSYVKCTSMSTRQNLSSYAKVTTWEESYTSNYVSIGSAKASVKYYMYNEQIQVQYQEGTFSITCTDEGNISDNA